MGWGEVGLEALIPSLPSSPGLGSLSLPHQGPAHGISNSLGFLGDGGFWWELHQDLEEGGQQETWSQGATLSTGIRNPTLEPGGSGFEPHFGTRLLGNFGRHWLSLGLLSWFFCTVGERVLAHRHGPFPLPATGETQSRGASRLVPTAATSELEHL